jgi:hypothetical protein
VDRTHRWHGSDSSLLMTQDHDQPIRQDDTQGNPLGRLAALVLWLSALSCLQWSWSLGVWIALVHQVRITVRTIYVCRTRCSPCWARVAAVTLGSVYVSFLRHRGRGVGLSKVNPEPSKHVPRRLVRRGFSLALGRIGNFQYYAGPFAVAAGGVSRFRYSPICCGKS